jgi:hypothetical protein
LNDRTVTAYQLIEVTVNLSHLVTHDLTVTVALNSADTGYGTGDVRDEAMAAAIGNVVGADLRVRPYEYSVRFVRNQH